VILIFGYAMPIAVLATYVVTYAYIRKRRLSCYFVKASFQNDISLLWQGFLVALSLIV
ncbi:hypothetical protein Angca_001698, partial [Angiostrongylus cantonensis]